MPVFSAPGAGVAKRSIGAWAVDRVVWLALDVDPAGQANLKCTAKAAYDAGARSVRRLVWPRPNKDACDTLRALGVERFCSFLREQIAGVIT